MVGKIQLPHFDAGSMTGPLNAVAEQVTGTIASLSDAVQAIVDVPVSVLGAIRDVIKQTLDAVNKVVNILKSLLRPYKWIIAVKEWLESAKKSIENVYQKVLNFSNGIKYSIATFTDKINAAVYYGANYIAKVANELVARIMQFLRKILNTAITWVSNLIDKVRGKVEDEIIKQKEKIDQRIDAKKKAMEHAEKVNPGDEDQSKKPGKPSNDPIEQKSDIELKSTDNKNNIKRKALKKVIVEIQVEVEKQAAAAVESATNGLQNSLMALGMVATEIKNQLEDVQQGINESIAEYESDSNNSVYTGSTPSKSKLEEICNRYVDNKVPYKSASLKLIPAKGSPGYAKAVEASVKQGADCSNFSGGVATQLFGINIPCGTPYQYSWYKSNHIVYTITQVRNKTVKPQPGDIILFGCPYYHLSDSQKESAGARKTPFISPKNGEKLFLNHSAIYVGDGMQCELGGKSTKIPAHYQDINFNARSPYGPDAKSETLYICRLKNISGATINTGSTSQKIKKQKK